MLPTKLHTELPITQQAPHQGFSIRGVGTVGSGKSKQALLERRFIMWGHGSSWADKASR
jgi:hypothetical protein